MIYPEKGPVHILRLREGEIYPSNCMAELFIYNNPVESVFQLLGTKENDMSYSVGYTLGRSDKFLQNLLKKLGVTTPFDAKKTKIRLQAHEKGRGFTDFEIVREGEFHVIIEAKRGWNFPTKEQLQKYVGRASFKNSSAKYKHVVVLNESIPAYTQTHFGISEIDEIPVSVVTWQTIQRLALKSTSRGRVAENHLLRELDIYLERTSTMQKIDSNWVYVVSLGAGRPERSTISWQDIVQQYSLYFHPVGGGRGGWPVEPPNYIAFRYDGVLQSVHHVDRYEVFTDPSQHFDKIGSQEWPPFYLYHLGPPMRPPHRVKAGKGVVRNVRLWAMLDLLLTSQTISEARDASKQREKSGSQ